MTRNASPLVCSFLLLALPAAHSLRSVRPLWDRVHRRESRSLPFECRASFALSTFERSRDAAAADPAPRVLARAGARVGGACTSIFVSGWLPAAVVADDPPAFLVNADPNAGALVLAAVLLLALPMARRQPSDPIQ